MTPHPDCEPQHHCRGCGKPVLCGEDIVVPWRSGRRYVVRHADRDGPTGWRRVYHCSTACYWRQLRARRREERSRSVICESCGGTFQAPRRGLIQALGRARGINRTAENPLTIYVLSNVVLPIAVNPCPWAT